MYITFIREPNNFSRMTNRDYNINDIFNGVEFNQNVPEPVQTIPTKYKTTMTVKTQNYPSSFNPNDIANIYLAITNLTRYLNPETIDLEYDTFYIPKSSGGLREINAPKDNLMRILKQMQLRLTYGLKVLYHNAAFAYVPNRNIKDALEKHKKKQSRWFLKLDIKDFFPSCNLEFVSNQLKQIYPFSAFSINQLNNMLWPCFKNNQLPQGTPMSPMLTNLVMIPVDFEIQEYAIKNHLTYTRYADDILISSQRSFDWRKVEDDIQEILAKETPFKLKEEKTRYGSAAGRNWNLGLMYNKDLNITVGYRKKKQYKAMLHNLLKDESDGNTWEPSEIRHFQGLTSYYLSIEPNYFKPLIEKYENTYNIKLKDIYKAYI